MSKKSLFSILLIIVSMAIIGGTIAFFSDTEISSGNSFVAGEIYINSTHRAWYNNLLWDKASWNFGEPIKKFFDFDDVKPQDNGKNTLTFKVETNDAWACANIKLTESAENGINKSENKSSGEDGLDGKWNGELDQELNFVFWNDINNDGLHQSSEEIIYQGNLSALPHSETNNDGLTFTLADASKNYFEASGSLIGKKEYHISEFWCFGQITTDPTRGEYLCDGKSVGNKSQNDSVKGDISIAAIQMRNNESFKCSVNGMPSDGNNGDTNNGGDGNEPPVTLGEEGSLDATLYSYPGSGTIIAENEEKIVAGYRLIARGSDINVQRFDIEFDQPVWKYVGYIALYEGDTEIKRFSNPSAADFEEIYFPRYRLRFSGFNHKIPKGEIRNFYIKIGHKPGNPYSVTAIRLYVNAIAIRGVDEAGINQYAPSASLSYRIFSVSSPATTTPALGSIILSTSTIGSDKDIYIGTAEARNNVTLGNFGITAKTYDMTVKKLSVVLTQKISSSGSDTDLCNTALLFEGDQLIAAAPVTYGGGEIMFSMFNLPLTKDQEKVLTIKVILNQNLETYPTWSDRYLKFDIVSSVNSIAAIDTDYNSYYGYANSIIYHSPKTTLKR